MKRIKHVFQRLNSSATPADYFLGITMVASLLTANTAIMAAMATSFPNGEYRYSFRAIVFGQMSRDREEKSWLESKALNVVE